MRELEITWGPNRDFVMLLSDSGARFFVSGGTAVRFHVPERREPRDLDLLVEPAAEMLAKLNAALAQVGEPAIRGSPEEFAKADKIFPSKGLLNVDILTPPAGVDFSEHWAAAEEAKMSWSPTRVRVASIPTLELLLRIGQERELLTEDFDADPLERLRKLAQERERAQAFAKDLELLARAVWRER